jgi:hypothetical protein
MKRILKGKLVHPVHGLGRDASHPWGTYCLKESSPMNKQEANQVLNEVKEGILYPQSVIIKALTITGDIHARCVNVESDIPVRNDARSSPYPLPSALQSD